LLLCSHQRGICFLNLPLLGSSGLRCCCGAVRHLCLERSAQCGTLCNLVLPPSSVSCCITLILQKRAFIAFV
jgi:hypothetical protein